MLFNGASGVSLDGTDYETTRTICENFESFFQNIDDTVTIVSQACYNNESSPMTHLPQCCLSVFNCTIFYFLTWVQRTVRLMTLFFNIDEMLQESKNVPAKMYLFYYIYSVAVKLVQYQIK